MTFLEFADKHFGWLAVLALIAIICLADAWGERRRGR